MSNFKYKWLEDTYNKIVDTHINGRGHHACLIQYEPNIGAEELSKKLAQFLLCTDPQNRQPCNKCYACRTYLEENNSDFYELKVEEDKTLISITDIRDIMDKINNFTSISRNKIIYIHECNKLNEYSANSLLKILEEPIDNTLFILDIPKSNAILQTIKSRCQQWVVNAPSSQETTDYIIKNGIPNQDQLLEFLKFSSNNRPLLAIEMYKKKWHEEYIRFLDSVFNTLNTLEIEPLAMNLENSIKNLDILNWKIELLIEVLQISIRHKITIQHNAKIKHKLINVLQSLSNDSLIKQLNHLYKTQYNINNLVGIYSSNNSMIGACYSIASSLILNLG